MIIRPFCMIPLWKPGQKLSVNLRSVSLTCRQWSVVKLDIAVRWLMRQCGRPQTDCRHACMKLVHQLAPCITGKITFVYKNIASYIDICWYVYYTLIYLRWLYFTISALIYWIVVKLIDMEGLVYKQWNFNDKKDIVNLLKFSCI